jgi:cysteinyl-tRNA synthetase
MEIKLYNFLSRKKEIFKPLKDKKAGIYTCGPTVYDEAHIGNLRTYIFEDILKRVLIYNGYKVKHIMNITDVEDKIIKKMQAENKTLKEITEPFIKIFFEDLEKLNIQKANVYPKATETIKEIIRLINILLKKGFAYKGNDGSIYFKISKFKNYGKLSQLKKRQIKSGARVNVDEYGKGEATDFVLWKTEKSGEPFWPAPFGNGRPGWHIECSAMSMKYLGEKFDIHCGATDLIFPHHENEIAQSEAATGKKFVNFWVEGEHLLVDNKKMSKSLGNFYTLKDIEKAGFNPLAFRYLILTTHYRARLNFTWQSLKAAQRSLDNLKSLVSEIKNKIGKTKTDPLFRRLADQSEQKFLKAANDDLNMPKALAILWGTIRNPKFSVKEKHNLILKFDKILGLNLKNVKRPVIPQDIMKLVKKREQLRREKNWEEADAIRKRLEKKGWIVKDTNMGSEISKSKI